MTEKFIMRKYIDADKLIAEIERRMEDCKLPDGRFPTTTNIVRYEELSCLLNFITDLQQEQPEVNLEKAFAHEYAIYHLPNFVLASIVDGTKWIDFIYKTARHFCEFGFNARKED